MLKIIAVIATRPDAIKMCPLIKEIMQRPYFELITISTGQHKDMLDDVLKAFNVKCDENLNIMTENQTLFSITESVMNGMKILLEKYNPDLVLVHGDTSSAFASALASYYMKIPVAHIEAGLRTYNKYSPYPEEFNRCAIDLLSNMCFAPTTIAKNNLEKEGINSGNIFVTGNTIIDALKYTKEYGNCDEILKWANGRKIILLTSHRRENIGKKMDDIFSSVNHVLEKHNDCCCVYPVHLNPQVKERALDAFANNNSVLLCEPLNVFDFHKLISKSYVILTDSGGIQEEAPSFNVPFIVCRDTTERPEVIESGAGRLCGTNKENIENCLEELISNKNVYLSMQNAENPYGDGFACLRICDIIKDRFNL